MNIDGAFPDIRLNISWLTGVKGTGSRDFDKEISKSFINETA